MFRMPRWTYQIYANSPATVRNAWASLYAVWSARRKYGAAYQYWLTLLAETQWYDADRLREFQLERALDFLSFAARESSFYRRRFYEYGFDPASMQQIEDLKRLPVLTKTSVRAHHTEIATRFASDRFLVLSSSGTTGAALHIPTDAETLQREYAFRWQHHAVAGAKYRDRFAVFTGHNIIPAARKRPPYWVRNFAENTMMFSLYHMSDQTMAHYVEAYNRFQPSYVEGYPSGIFVLARFAKRMGLTLIRPRAIFTASETLHDAQRSEIETAFGAPVFQWYGQVEMTVNLHECQLHRLHIKEEYGYLELLKDDGTDAKPGETGTVVATGLGNRAFPLVRYQTTDKMELATDQKCACGRGGRIISRILGRDEDFIVTPDGRYIGRLDFVFKPIETVAESQIVQENLNTIVVKVVPLPGFTRADERRIETELRTRIGQTMKVQFDIVDSIPRGPGGKLRYVISKMGQP
jgi:phenylacetate-CoA ligase